MEWIEVERDRLEDAAEKAARVLGAGGVIVFPAERLYGIGVDALNREAVKKVFALKGRGQGMPLPVIVGDTEKAREWVDISETARALMENFWPGPLTLVLPLKGVLPKEVVAGGKELGIRVPGAGLALEIALITGNPITATSSNPSGGESGRNAREAVSGLEGEVDLVLDLGELAGPPGSTVARPGEGDIEILREGIIGREQLELIIRGTK